MSHLPLPARVLARLRPARLAPRPPAARPARPTFHLGLVVAVVLLVVGALGLGSPAGTPSAVAHVVHHQGYQATVFGWTSWYGSYDLGAIGYGWCIDHGSLAPDAAFGYQPTSIDAETDGDTQAALAWIATTYPPSSAVEAAAVMLALHDLRRAVYPFGRLDVDRLQVANLGGFGGAEGLVLQRAREIKADGLAHARVHAPFHVHLEVVPTATGVESVGTALVTDAAGAPVPGLTVEVTVAGPRLTSPGRITTGPAGDASFTFVSAEGENRFFAEGRTVDPRPHVWGPTTIRAQRIIRPALLPVSGSVAFTLAAPTTTTTTTAPPTTTTTTAPTTTTSTTSTTQPTTTTTTTTTSTSTTTPSTTTSTTSTSTSTTSTTTSTTSTSTSTTTPASTTTTVQAASPPSVPAGPAPPTTVVAGPLPHTGTPARSMALIGAGLVLLGVSLVARSRGPVPVARA